MPVATFDWMQERLWPYLLRERRAPQIFVASPAGAVMHTFFKRWLCYEHGHGCVNNYFLLRAFRRKCVTRALCAWDARSATGSSRGSPLNTSDQSCTAACELAGPTMDYACRAACAAGSLRGWQGCWPQVALPLLSHRCQHTFRVAVGDTARSTSDRHGRSDGNS